MRLDVIDVVLPISMVVTLLLSTWTSTYTSLRSNARRATVITTPHFGIRYTQDLTGDYSDYVVDSVDLLNSQLAPHELRFFDSCDFFSRLLMASTAGICAAGSSRMSLCMSSSLHGLKTTM